jgi:hypothetical protein
MKTDKTEQFITASMPDGLSSMDKPVCRVNLLIEALIAISTVASEVCSTAQQR